MPAPQNIVFAAKYGLIYRFRIGCMLILGFRYGGTMFEQDASGGMDCLENAIIQRAVWKLNQVGLGIAILFLKYLPTAKDLRTIGICVLILLGFERNSKVVSAGQKSLDLLRVLRCLVHRHQKCCLGIHFLQNAQQVFQLRFIPQVIK
ncbi:hypothetical protein SDC9_189885 [bioreactor metagenome]|uniref:Uncharacterized protein n=1 Tax=bioreactor metagenome TaxID=1076179 RepID=A0A645HTF4_9ZZZZ